MKLAMVKAIVNDKRFMNLYVPQNFLILRKEKNFFMFPDNKSYLHMMRDVYNWKNAKLKLCGFAILDDYGNIKKSWLFRKGESLYAHRKWTNKR